MVNIIKSIKEKIIAKKNEKIINDFHNLYYNDCHQTWLNTNWFGVSALKCPLDLWIYQEILFETKPDLIIETGTANGGSAFYLASLMDLLGNGEIVSVDIDAAKPLPEHKRITYIEGSSTAPEIVDKVKSMTEGKNKILIILDSDHSKRHVLDELKIYNKFVTKGSYLIVEDSNVNGHPTYPQFGPGPWEAIEDFLKENSEFEIDKSREKFYMTLNPNGYLKKIYEHN